MSRTVMDLMAGADDDVAIDAPGRLPPMTYAGLRAHVERIGERLAGFGIGRGDRVAIVLDGGPELAAAFLAIAGCATPAPLNPAYRCEEFEYLLGDLGVKALLTSTGAGEAAPKAATRSGVPILRLSVREGAPAGTFEIEPADRSALPAARRWEPAEPDDVALLLHTSGTTSRPKLVPLTQENLWFGGQNVSSALALTPQDRCLGLMPLFHIHGIVGSVLASVAAGGSVVCPDGFNAFRFFPWLRDQRPTWYTAVPTMHQAILSRAPDNASTNTLRLIRSSSSPLPQRVMNDLEKTFEVPVIESYGMTEASHQMTSNPLPPAARKPGTVGLASGPQIGVIDANGDLVPAGSLGEICVRGPNVMSGYERNAEANAQAFVNGWFRTGDQGGLDADGYLTISGRLKEIINRGGEKVSPREIEDVLLDHLAVDQAVVFPVPHERLGEEVAAAVVVRVGASATRKELRVFAGERLAAFKVPRTLLFLDEIPKGPTGKPQRLTMAQALGLSR
jgi:acyl-CoA synthetase (AMP-forming)/AMP-acid ligase II